MDYGDAFNGGSLTRSITQLMNGLCTSVSFRLRETRPARTFWLRNDSRAASDNLRPAEYEPFDGDAIGRLTQSKAA